MQLLPSRDPLPPGVMLYSLDLDLDLATEAVETWQDLTAEERARAACFAQRADRVRFAATRATLRRLLAKRLGCAPAEVPLHAGRHGKPCVDERLPNAPLFSVSHSGCRALIALADPRALLHVGVDIEQCHDDLDADALLDLAFTQAERHAIRSAGDSLHALHARWVGKEAALKSIGVGIAEHLPCIGIHPRADGRLDIACDIPEWAGLQAMTLRAPQGYAAALAWHARTNLESNDPHASTLA
ncbi:4-phosphopantetheinyl transferase [Variovorax sp. WS11]|uniref:4'-phosphopantetheinyl transferase family protein n=1 Tax=Variovorax sp. WS11 TaxID=1105204 RepID=UPI000D0D3500|nr:4'-phosphopantetheinyl transferase superfamily protein [Variovorax sp. WS11]NDZ18116.1 4'-phosphopantetheinyl transferase superfamily protein [Variovorax sp. WS11]PSL79929.1 4-phosphopantetheinyl transferase [Variovorax sp. WS11]